MPIDAESPGVGKIGGKLQEERPEIKIHAVEVILIDQSRGAHNPRVGRSRRRIPTFLRPEHRDLLLSFANEQNTLLSFKAGAVLRRDIIFALSLAEEANGNLILLRKNLDGPDEPLRDGVHQGRRGEGIPKMGTEEGCHPSFRLKVRYVDVEIEAVNPLDLQGDPVTKDLSDTLRYTHRRLRLTRSLGTISRSRLKDGPSLSRSNAQPEPFRPIAKTE